jgi:hypothetical protein
MTSICAPIGLTVEEIDANASALASILASVTGCVLIKQNIKYRNVSVPKPEPANSTPLTRSGVFFFSTDATHPDGIVTVPAIKDSVISDVEPFAGVDIDLDNADIAALVDAIIGLDASNPFGDLFSALLTAYIQSRV